MNHSIIFAILATLVLLLAFYGSEKDEEGLSYTRSTNY